MLSSELMEVFKSTFFKEHLRAAASGLTYSSFISLITVINFTTQFNIKTQYLNNFKLFSTKKLFTIFQNII